MKITQTAAKLNISRQRLCYWQNIGLLSGKDAVLPFIDVVRARFILLCRRKGVSLQSIRQAAAERPSWHQDLGLYENHILALREKSHWLQPENGQLFLEFKKTENIPLLCLEEEKTKKMSGEETPEEILKLEQEYQKALGECKDKRVMEGILKKIIALGPDRLSAWIEMGNFYFAVGKIKAASQAYEHSLELDPFCAEALYNLANLHFKEKRYAVAIRCFQNCLKADPQFSEAYYNFGLVMFHLKRYEESGRLLETYIEFDPSSSWAEQASQVIEDIQSILSQRAGQDEPLLFE